MDAVPPHGHEMDEMLGVNQRQAEFYESIQKAETSRPGAAVTTGGGYSANEHAGPVTRLWAEVRNHRKRLLKQSGLRDRLEQRFRDLIGDAAKGRVLEIGCFNGTRNTLWLVEQCKHYTGLDLSASAVGVLREKVAERGWADKATLVAGDVLKFNPTEKFDLVYAQGVLHHFKHPEVLFPLLRGFLKPGGRLVFSDPSEVNPVLRFFRRLYRPFQSDQAWEWPFNRATVRALEQSFRLVDAFGYGRASSLLIPLLSVPGASYLFGGASKALIDRELLEPFDVVKVWNQAVVFGVAERLPDEDSPS